MSFARPTLAELITRTTADLVSRLQLESEVMRRAFVRTVSRVWSGAVHALYGHLDWSSRQHLVSTCDAEFLDAHGAEYELSRLPATYASGEAIFSGADGAIVPAGTRVQRADGVEYLVQADAAIDAGGTVAVAVDAVDAGADGNSGPGTALTLTSSIPAVFAAAAAPDGITGGNDVESDARFRARVLERKRAAPQGGALVDYEIWAKEVAGVTRVWVRPQWMGAGTVGVLFVADDAGTGYGEDIIPDAGLVADVQAYLTDPARAPVCAEIYAVAPVPLTITMTIALSPNTAAVQAAVTAELIDLFRRAGEPGSTIPLSQIREAISIAPGETYHEMIAPVDDVVAPANQIPVLGDLTFSAA